MAAPEVPTVATRQLFVKFKSAKPHHKNELADIFSPSGPILRIFMPSSHAVAYVTFLRFMDACDAKERLDQRAVRSSPSSPELQLQVQFVRATRLLFIDSIPQAVLRDAIIADVEREFGLFGSLHWIEVVLDKRGVYICFNHLNEAAQAVNALRGRTFGAWQWEIEFHKVRRCRVFLKITWLQEEYRPSRSAYFIPDTQAKPAAAQMTQSTLSSASASDVLAILLPSPAPHVPFTVPATVNALLPLSGPPVRSRTRSPTPEFLSSIGSSASSRNHSASPKSRASLHRDRQHAHLDTRDDATFRDPKVSSPNSVSIKDLDSAATVQRNSACHQEYRCELHLSSQRLTEREMTKKLLKAWYRGKWTFVSRLSHGYSEKKHRHGDTEMYITRRDFLNDHINAFLSEMELPSWHKHTDLYVNWFIPKVMRLERSEAKAEEWHMFKKHGNEVFRAKVERLLKALD